MADVPYGPTTSGQNIYLIQVNASYNWDWKTNITERAYSKTNNDTMAPQVPIVMKGALYSGAEADSRIWLFGGTTSYQNTSGLNYTSPTPDTYALWSYNTSSAAWDPHDVTSAVPTRPYNGFTAESAAKGLGFWINGDVDSGSSVAASALGSYNERFQPGMLLFDFTQPTPNVTNTTGPPWGDPRVGGLAHYVPNYGPEGVLIAFGGGSSPAEAQSSSGDQGQYAPMTDIWVWDVSQRHQSGGGGWYMQPASGDIPPAREDSCAVGFAAPDNSSYQVFAYGGRNQNDAYDDMYALSLPSFTWTRIYAGTSPRWGHTCARVNGAQMLTAGGSPNPANVSSCDWETRGVAVYDFAQQQWGSRYTVAAQAGKYQVAPLVARAIGGNGGGGATKMAPSMAWSSEPLANLFGQHATAAAGSGSSSGSGLSGGAIAGIVIGVVAFVAIVAALVMFLVVRPRRRRSKAAAADAGAGEQDAGMAKQVVTAEDGAASPHADGATPIQEKDGTSAFRQEKEGDTLRQEMEAPGEMRYEMDASQVAELPGPEVHKP